MSKKLVIIIAVIIAAALIAVSFFVDDVMPYVYGALALNLLNIIVYTTKNKDNK